jgi:hypothetical protein
MFRSTALVLLLALAGVQAGISVSTPSNDGTLEACKTYTFDISGDSGPYYGFIVSGDDPCGPALKEIGPITGNKYTWTVDVPAGKTVMLAVENDADIDGYSGKLTVKGNNSTCVAAASASVHASSHATAPNNAANPTGTSAAPRNFGNSLFALGFTGAAAALTLAL